MSTLRIPDSAFSYIETDVAEVVGDPEGYGLDMEEYTALKTLMLYMNMETSTLNIPTSFGDRERIADVFTDLSNNIDDTISDGRSDNKRFDAAASKSFATLASKLRKHV